MSSYSKYLLDFDNFITIMTLPRFNISLLNLEWKFNITPHFFEQEA